MEKLRIPKDLWLRFGCFLSGYNYNILNECSEASKKDVKKITSALIIITMIWATVGYIFSIKYLNSGALGGIIGSLFLTILIIQIERQIILTRNLGWKIKIARFLLGFIVAMIGATVVDQYIFKQDIAKLKNDFAEERVKMRINKDTKLHFENSSRFDSLINVNVNLLNKLNSQLKTTPPLITVIASRDPETGKVTGYNTIPNPQFQNLQNQITNLTNDNIRLNNNKTQSAKDLNNTVTNQQNLQRSEEAGFLDELELMVKFLINYKEYGKEYPVALIFYLFWLLFFLLIELSVLILKSSGEETDYDKIVAYQQKIREQRLMALEDKRNAALGSDQNIDQSNSLVSNMPR
jgi:hypothetical protein